jgi:hypothetical protein
VRIRVRRVGGFAGNIPFGAELDTAELPADQAKRVEAALDGLPWDGAAGAPPHPDAFRYEVELADHPDRGSAVLQEGQLAGDLDPLRTWLEEHGEIG